MDAEVIAAMARWPDVPAVYGWLSLSESGHWRLHPGGNAISEPSSAGEPITSPQILAFMDRNYDVDAQGSWFFQNGPQRVYVRLDAAPFIAHIATDAATGQLKLRTHTGLDIERVSGWYLDESGRLYASTERGAALISGRDLSSLIDRFAAAGSDDPVQADPDGNDMTEILAQCMESGATVHLVARGLAGASDAPLPLQPCAFETIAERLGFVRYPEPASH